MNYYNLFQLPQSPIVDRILISKKYVELQKQYHPDYFTKENEEDKENALAISANINKAYNIFSNVDKTIEYFLQIKNVIIADEKYNLPPNFLMEMMELNETFNENINIENDIKSFENALNETIKPILALDASSVLDENTLQQLKLYYYKKKYLKRILERLED